MKLKLAVALAVLFIASQAHADTVVTDTFEAGPLVWTIPDGSTVTGQTQSELGDNPFNPLAFTTNEPVNTLEYSFADGTGEVSYSEVQAFGEIQFSTPVSDLSFSWLGGFPFFEAEDNAGDFFYDSVDGAGTVTFAGTGITQLYWAGPSPNGGGISALDSTSDSQGVPEPSSLLLFGVGLAALIGLKLKA